MRGSGVTGLSTTASPSSVSGRPLLRRRMRRRLHARFSPRGVIGASVERCSDVCDGAGSGATSEVPHAIDPEGGALSDPPVTAAAVHVVPSLGAFDEAAIAAVCEGAGPFFTPRWFAMVEEAGLSALLGGAVDVRYVVATRDGRPAALCPVLRVRSRSVYFGYSLEKYFFSSWQTDLRRMAPALSPWIPWMRRLLAGFQRALHVAGARTDGWLLAISPLSFRGRLVVGPGEPDGDVLRMALIERLKDLAAEEDLPLCVYGVEGRDAPTRGALRRADLRELFLFPDMALPVPPGGLPEYLAGFRNDRRKAIRRALRAAEAQRVRFEATRDWDGLADRIAAQYAATYGRHNEDHVRAPAAFWRTLGRRLGDHASLAVARDGDDVLAFVTELFGGGEQFQYRGGRTYDDRARRAGVHFNLAATALQRAADRGVRLLWLGPNAWEGKHWRGAIPHPLYLHWWFPRRAPRALLLPYLRLFARVTHRLVERYERPTSGLKAETLDRAYAQLRAPAGASPIDATRPRSTSATSA